MAELIRYPDRSQPGQVIDGRVIKSRQRGGTMYYLCQPITDGRGAAIGDAVVRQEWLRADEVEFIESPLGAQLDQL